MIIIILINYFILLHVLSYVYIYCIIYIPGILVYTRYTRYQFGNGSLIHAAAPQWPRQQCDDYLIVVAWGGRGRVVVTCYRRHPSKLINYVFSFKSLEFLFNFMPDHLRLNCERLNFVSIVFVFPSYFPSWIFHREVRSWFLVYIK